MWTNVDAAALFLKYVLVEWMALVGLVVLQVRDKIVLAVLCFMLTEALYCAMLVQEGRWVNDYVVFCRATLAYLLALYGVVLWATGSTAELALFELLLLLPIVGFLMVLHAD
jgi:hypothetical protein